MSLIQCRFLGAGVARISNRSLTHERSICSATQTLQHKSGPAEAFADGLMMEGSSEFRADRLDLLKGETTMKQVQQVQVVSIFTIEIDGNPTLAFEAKNMTEARGLCKEQWLREDLGALSSGGSTLCGVGAKLAVRRATEGESHVYREAEQSVPASDDLVLAYLVELDGFDTQG